MLDILTNCHLVNLSIW